MGLLLVFAAAPAGYFVRSETHVISQPGAWNHASYTDYDLRLPIGLAVSGLVVVAVALIRMKPAQRSH